MIKIPPRMSSSLIYKSLFANIEIDYFLKICRTEIAHADRFSWNFKWSDGHYQRSPFLQATYFWAEKELAKFSSRMGQQHSLSGSAVPVKRWLTLYRTNCPSNIIPTAFHHGCEPCDILPRLSELANLIHLGRDYTYEHLNDCGGE